ncbi:MAG: hypothetical protein K2J39_11505 [Ruminococcus sp.]|nr:hypothetical protein [Ruminococcus sp.]
MINQIVMLFYTDPLESFRDSLEDFGRGLFWGFAFYFVFLPLIFLIALIAFIVSAVSYSKAKQRMDKNIDYYRHRMLICRRIFFVVVIIVAICVCYLFFA